MSASDNGGHHDGGSGQGLAVSFAGTWEGTWAAPTAVPTGLLTLQLDQTGTSVVGTATFGGHLYFATCTVSCQVSGHEMSGWLSAGTAPMMLSGSCPESNHCSGPHRADTLTAIYEIQDGPCAGESGVMHLVPVAAAESRESKARAIYGCEVILLDPTDGNVVRLPPYSSALGAHFERARIAMDFHSGSLPRNAGLRALVTAIRTMATMPAFIAGNKIPHAGTMALSSDSTA